MRRNKYRLLASTKIGPHLRDRDDVMTTCQGHRQHYTALLTLVLSLVLVRWARSLNLWVLSTTNSAAEVK